jgi:cytochrome P450
LSKLLDFLPAAGIAHLATFTLQQISETRKMLADSKSSGSSDAFLKKLLDMQAKNPDTISNADIFTTCITNIGAGSDSTSVSLTAILYNLCKHPKVYQKVRLGHSTNLYYTCY